MMKHTKGFLLTLGALMLAPAVANAETDPHGSAALLLGWGFEDPGQFGLGARGGYTLPQSIYLGGTFMYHLGSSEDFGPVERSFNVYYFGFEGGYDFELEPVTIRPYIGIGPAFVHSKAEGPGASASDTETEFGFWLGDTVLYNIDEQWFVGGDLRILAVNGGALPTLSVTGGLNF